MKILKRTYVGGLLIFIILLFSANHFIFRVGYGFPGREIDFSGLSKNEAIQKIFENNLAKAIAVDGNNWRRFGTFEEAAGDKLIMASDTWGVNQKTAGIAIYNQILLFDKDGKVYKQTAERLNDGP